MTSVQVTREVPADHPAFAGHFPGQPLLPGVLLLAEVLEAARLQPALAARVAAGGGFPQAKFLAPVRPGSTLHIALDWTDTAALRFEVRCGERLAAKGQWQPGAGA